MFIKTKELERKYLIRKFRNADLQIEKLRRVSKFPKPLVHFDLSFGWQAENDSYYNITLIGPGNVNLDIYTMVTTLLGCLVVWSRYFEVGTTRMQKVYFRDLRKKLDLS